MRLSNYLEKLINLNNSLHQLTYSRHRIKLNCFYHTHAEIEILDRDIILAFLEQDFEFLERVLIPGFGYTETSGEQLSGKEFVEAFKSGELGFHNCKIRTQNNTLYPNQSLVSGDLEFVTFRNGAS
jgi:hypothetical protein